jgi:hypothetical protein
MILKRILNDIVVMVWNCIRMVHCRVQKQANVKVIENLRFPFKYVIYIFCDLVNDAVSRLCSVEL